MMDIDENFVSMSGILYICLYTHCRTVKLKAKRALYTLIGNLSLVKLDFVALTSLSMHIFYSACNKISVAHAGCFKFNVPTVIGFFTANYATLSFIRTLVLPTL